MKLKKITLTLVAIMILTLLVGCQSHDKTQKKNDETSTNQIQARANKTLVVYYSATGNTKDVANMIAKQTDGQLFEIEPRVPYSNEDLDWTNDNSRVTREHENESERNVELVTTTVDDWDSYDTVFIGYPIWWGIAAWPVDNFVKNKDFSQKTVIPFCTSSSSEIGESGELLAKIARTGNWQEGQRFRSSASNLDVQTWLDELELENN